MTDFRVEMIKEDNTRVHFEYIRVSLKLVVNYHTSGYEVSFTAYKMIVHKNDPKSDMVKNPSRDERRKLYEKSRPQANLGGRVLFGISNGLAEMGVKWSLNKSLR